MTAFPQLVSRICHAHDKTYRELSSIIVKVLNCYPYQAAWLIIAVSQSTYPTRKARCMEILDKVKAGNPKLTVLLGDMSKLQHHLIELCNKKGNDKSLSLPRDFKNLKKLLTHGELSNILIPIQSQLTVHLTGDNPFPSQPVYIRGLEDNIEVLCSLQRPKKIILQGSDGNLYPMLAKPKDDLRKDARLMEFNSLVNTILQRDPESRRRRLRIRTYAVIPLNEECGLLEWVKNTSGLRNILLKLYKEKRLYVSGAKLKQWQLPVSAKLEKKLKVFKENLLPNHPSVFSQWFLRTFPDSTAWFNAHLLYCRSVATMSVVGYILGLGDRHGENILFDSNTGEVVHVDFNCLFNKGESFDFPEVVPFRLTHNMVEAMGPLGTRGLFHQAAVNTLNLMVKQKETLMNVLSSFLYDPLVEWRPSRCKLQGEVKNEEGKTSISMIEERLKGYVKSTQRKTKGLPLAADGHVDLLIKEATDENNLCQMYLGWAAYM